MNSIFTNALPGQNEDEHIYTLKERFNQSGEENGGTNSNINNNSTDNRYEHNRDEEPMISDIQRDKYKDYNDQNLDYSRNYHFHHHSRSRTRRGERDRSRDKYRRDNPRSLSRKFSRSNSRNYRRSRSRSGDYDRKKRGMADRERDNINMNYQRQYSSFSYVENGVTKINTYFTVPDHLVSFLIGKKGENVRDIMKSTGAVVTFCKEVRIIFNNNNFFYIV